MTKIRVTNIKYLFLNNNLKDWPTGIFFSLFPDIPAMERSFVKKKVMSSRTTAMTPKAKAIPFQPKRSTRFMVL